MPLHQNYFLLTYKLTIMNNTIKTPLAVILLLAISCKKENINVQSPTVKQSTYKTLTFTIGQHYGGGIIFHIDSTGQHGLIAAVKDQSAGIQWYNGTYTTTGAIETALGTGKANTKKIITSQGRPGKYAATKCANYQGNGFADWFLPSKDELSELYTQRAVVGGFAGGNYWSSSETATSALSAYNLDFFDGSWHNNFKNTLHSVRAVRAF